MALVSDRGNELAPMLGRAWANWTGENTAGSAAIGRYEPKVSCSCASIQFTGTFGGATVALQGSNDGVTFVTLKDLQGNNITATAAGYFEFTSGARFLKLTITGGTGDSINGFLNHWAG